MQKMTFSSCRQAGFTMLELIVVVAIAAILMAVAIPSFQTLSLSTARSQGSTLLLSALSQARANAISRNAQVNICPRAFFASGDPSCNTNTVWAQGWIVYVDKTADGSATTPASATDVIGVFEPMGSVKSTPADGSGNAFNIKTTSSTVRFQSNGRATAAAVFTVCDNTNHLTDSRRVEVALSGYVSLRSMSTACPS